MSEIKFRGYGELEVAESLSDNSHMLVEENGEVKRFPAKGIGAVSATIHAKENEEYELEYTLTGATYDELVGAMDNGAFPNIILRHPDGYMIRAAAVCGYSNCITVTFVSGDAIHLNINADGSVGRPGPV